MTDPTGKRTGICCVWLLVGLTAGCQEAPVSRPSLPAAPGTKNASTTPQLVGTASCSGRACHGNGGPVAESAVQQNEFSTWSLHDHHADAFAVLLNERSRKIARNLQLPGDRAEHDLRCLACHTNPLAAVPSAGPLYQEERHFGVGCESCHGPASQWLVPHTTASWKKLSAAEKLQQGMYPVDDLAFRAEVCAGCHVGKPADEASGTPARDLYHDLLGAGHPRLKFELGSFQAHLPPHWIEKARTPAHEAQLWAVGQAVSARLALELLAERASNRTRPWPEFAEYDCAACHHELREPPQWHPAAGQDRLPLSALPLSNWYFALLPSLPDGPSPTAELAALRLLMGQRYPDREQVAQRARTAARQLHEQAQRLNAKQFDATTVQQLLQGLVQRGVPEERGSWEGTDQFCLALLALTEARHRGQLHQAKVTPAEHQTQLEARLRPLIEQLTRAGVNGQRAWRRDADFKKHLTALLETLRD